MQRFVKIGLGFNHSVTTFGKAITWVTTKWYKMFSKEAREKCPTHVWIWFECEKGERIYYEALEGEGFQGPLPISKIYEWALSDTRHWTKDYDLTKFVGLSPEDLTMREQFCNDMTKYWSYNTARIPLQLRTAGLARLLIPSSPRDVICSEAGSRVLHTDLLDFREICKKKNHDDISPRVLMDGVLKLIRPLDDD